MVLKDQWPVQSTTTGEHPPHLLLGNGFTYAFIHHTDTEHLLYAREIVDVYVSGYIDKKPCARKSGLECPRDTVQVQEK